MKTFWQWSIWVLLGSAILYFVKKIVDVFIGESITALFVKMKAQRNIFFTESEQDSKRIQDGLTIHSPHAPGILYLGTNDRQTTAQLDYSPQNVFNTQNINEEINTLVRHHCPNGFALAQSKILLHWNIIHSERKRARLYRRTKRWFKKFYKTHQLTVRDDITPDWLKNYVERLSR